jgi:hypothetical protein
MSELRLTNVTFINSLESNSSLLQKPKTYFPEQREQNKESRVRSSPVSHRRPDRFSFSLRGDLKDLTNAICIGNILESLARLSRSTARIESFAKGHFLLRRSTARIESFAKGHFLLRLPSEPPSYVVNQPVE